MKCDRNKDLLDKFQKAKINDMPDFSGYSKPLEMGLWVLWVSKEKLNVKMLTAYEIANIILNVMENSINTRTIVNAFNRARNKMVHMHNIGGKTYYEIMKQGKQHLIKEAGRGSIAIYYFEAEKRYYSKNVLANNILTGLTGEIKIVDPYCSERTLDILSKAKVKHVKFLTRIENLSENNQKRFLRDLKDFKTENDNFEFRSYSGADIHDRYIISPDIVVILGHSMKDLGAKESFAVVFDKKTNRNIFDALVENFNRRWKKAGII